MNDDVRRPGRVYGPAEPVESGVKEERPAPTDAVPDVGPVIADADPVVEEEPEVEEHPAGPVKSRSSWAKVIYVAAALIAVLVTVQWGTYLSALWASQFWLAILLSLLTIALVIVLGRTLFIEVRAARRVDQLEARQQKIEQALKENRLDLLQDALSPVIVSLRRSNPGVIAEFENAEIRHEDEAADYIRLFENLVLSELDKTAQKEIDRHSMVIGGAVAVLPHPALDAVFVLWRSGQLIRRIGQIYGLQPTGLASLRLMKLAIANALLAAGMDALGAAVGARVGGKALGGAAETAVLVVRIRRLGETTRRLCRVVPIRK